METKYLCKNCNYKCTRSNDWMKHQLTQKHISNNLEYTENTKLSHLSQTNICSCGKIYKFRSGLWKHKKTCTVKEISNTPALDNNLVITLLKDNADFKSQVIELLKHQSQQVAITDNTHNTINNTTNTNTINNEITINMFINEHCKNAMTLEHFMNTIQVTVDDILLLAKKGNRDGLTTILKEAFGKLQITERPVHCTDKKRHTTYIKDDDGWKKGHDQPSMLRLCRKLEGNTMKVAIDTINSDPIYKQSERELGLAMMLESVGGSAGSDINHPFVVRALEDFLSLDKTLIRENMVSQIKSN